MAVTVESDSLWTGKVRGTVAWFSEHADEGAIGIEDLNPLIQRVGDVQVSVRPDCEIRRPGEGSRCVVGGLLRRTAHRAEGAEIVHGVDDDIVVENVGDINETILVVDSDSAGTGHALGAERSNKLVVRIKDEYATQARVGYEEAISIVQRQADQRLEASVASVANKVDALVF